MLPEARLVLAAARGDVGSLDATARVTWDRVPPLAAAHQVAGLTHHASGERLARSGGPEDVLRRLELAFWHDAARNELLRRDLGELQRALLRARVDALVLKGPSLALRAYPHPGTRPVGDVDLCVGERDYERVVEVLRSLGYAAVVELPDRGERALEVAHHASQLRFAAPGRRPVELHFRLVHAGPPRAEPWLWATARELDVGTATVRVPGPEALLLHLLLHAAQHGFAVLRLLHDVRFALEVDRGVLDPLLLIEMARPYRCNGVLFHALVLAESMAGARVPPELRAALDPGRLRRARFERLWSLARVRALEAPLWPDALEAPRLYLLGMDTLGRRLRYLRDVVRQNGGPVRSTRRLLDAVRGERAPSPPASAPAEEGGAAARLPSHPRVRGDALVLSLGERTVVHLPAADRTVVLPRAARELAALCTGARSLGELVSATARSGAVAEQVVFGGVVEALMDLQRGGFLVPPERG